MGGNIRHGNPNAATSKGLVELNYDRRDRHKVISNAASEEEESRNNESNGDINNGRRGAKARPTVRDALLMQQPPPQQLSGPFVHWERIFPVRTLKVLLVENDDSTRQVVSALLRNCSYEVTAAANGLQAWKILENPANHTDLVLTEVVMPGLSGIALLCKITSHDRAKNIPVIMMSSNDSTGMVFKCLSKGAVDFLVKPIRKNELKNLWQHVWRRFHSSSGSVSESGIRTQKSAKSRSTDDSENNTSSNDDDDNASVGLNVRDGSDTGSGTHSSCTKHAVEVDSPQPMSPSDQLADRYDSTCAQGIPEAEERYNKWVPGTTDRECHKQKNIADEYMGIDLEIGLPRNPETHDGCYPTEKAATKLPGTSIVNQHEIGKKNEYVLGLQGSNTFDEPSTKAADLIGGIANNTDTQILNSIHESPNSCSRISESKEKNNYGSVLPSVQLSLKRLRSTGEVRDAAQDDRNVFRRSVQSAFSKYQNSAASAQAPTGYGGSCSPIDNSSEAVKRESANNMISYSNPATAKQVSNGSSDNNDMGSTTNNVFTNPSVYKEKAAPALVVKSMHPSAFHLVQLWTSAPPKVMLEKTDKMAATTMAGQTIGIQSQVQVQHHNFQSMEQQQQPPEHDDLSHKKHTAVSAQLCGSSNVFAAAVEGNAANCSLNGSNSGSNHISSGRKGSIPAVNAGGANMECADGFTDKCGVGGGNGIGSGSGSRTEVDQNRSAQREAALNRFRQKRKERNFGEKVCYQSRKRLAEQRPRDRDNLCDKASRSTPAGK